MDFSKVRARSTILIASVLAVAACGGGWGEHTAIQHRPRWNGRRQLAESSGAEIADALID